IRSCCRSYSKSKRPSRSTKGQAVALAEGGDILIAEEDGEGSIPLAQRGKPIAAAIKERRGPLNPETPGGVGEGEGGAAVGPAGAAADAELEAQLAGAAGGVAEGVQELRGEEALVADAPRGIVQGHRVSEAGHHPAHTRLMELLELEVDLLAAPGRT